MPTFVYRHGTRETPAKSTSANYFHDIPITRANIELENLERARRERPPLVTPGAVCSAFVMFPEERHLRRAAKLLRQPQQLPA